MTWSCAPGTPSSSWCAEGFGTIEFTRAARREGQLATAERELANLDALEVEVAWVARCLTDFDGVWDVLTPENRGRLLRAVIQRVEVNEPANQVSVFLADLGAEAPTEAASQPAQQEVSP